MRIGDVDFWKEVIKGPGMLDRRTAVRHDNNSSFTAEEVDQQLKEGIDRKCLRTTG